MKSPERSGSGNRPFVIGVTGNIASGKSSVSRRLAELGAEWIDADAVYHELIASGSPLWSQLIAEFGPGIVGEDSQIDRRALGAIVFADPAKLATLDALTHPAVNAEVWKRIASSTSEVVVLEAVKLIESGSADRCARVWLVESTPEIQVRRLMQRNGLSREAAEMRVAAQPDIAQKRGRADVVIQNDGSLAVLKSQVDGLFEAIASRHFAD